MDRNYHLQYTFTHKEWYETFDVYEPNEELLLIVRPQVPEGWQIKRSGVWFHVINPNQKLAVQGWKIHISARPDNCDQILSRAARICMQELTPFKFALDRRVVTSMTSKGWSREGGSKFITIYPNDDLHFHRLITLLGEELKEFKGPHILSDKRLPGSSVVHYRYGGISGESVLTIKGTRQYVLHTPDDTVVPDERLPFWNPPYWVEDPFPDDPESDSDDVSMTLRDGRYEIHTSLNYSLYGGVYFATDLDTGTSVVIKEARPHTGVDEHGNDATDRLKKEFRLLTKLEDTGFTPRPIELFWEWEHLFLVEEYCAGTTLGQYTIKTSPFIKNSSSLEERKRFFATLINIWKYLATAIQEIHNRNIVLGDISLLNLILMNEETGTIKILDLEAAWEVGVDKPLTNFGTPGFLPAQQTNGKEDDIYSLGAIFLGMIGPSNVNISLLDQEVASTLLELGGSQLGLPQTIRQLILDTKSNDAVSRPKLSEIIARLDVQPELDMTCRLPDRHDKNELNAIVNNCLSYIYDVADYNRNNRLIPADPLVFVTNPNSVAHGAAGIVHALSNVGRDVPKSIVDWMLAHSVQSNAYTPGLFIGSSGVAWSLWGAGFREEALRVMSGAHDHPLLLQSPDMYYGASGYGLTCLQFYMETGEQIWLDRAVHIGEWLIRTKEINGEVAYWRDSEGRVQLGYAFGSSGIALYLLYLHLATGIDAFMEVAEQALEHDLSHLIKLPDIAMSMPRGPVGTKGMKVLSHYWIEGSSGVGTSLARFWKVTGKPRYMDVLRDLSGDSFRKYTSTPGLFRGLSGLGNFLIDMYTLTGEAMYLDQSQQVGSSVAQFAIKRGEGIAFPGDQALRLSADYGTGSAGIALFLNRLVHADQGAPNFNFTMDGLFAKDIVRASVGA